jgi:hypothetical protein
MAFGARVLADSLAPSGNRLFTIELTFPRIILAEFNTHRVMSRNTSSSRAIPVSTTIRRVEEDPFIPVHWGKNQKGMQADQEITAEAQTEATKIWLGARDDMVKRASALTELGIHKQLTNRLLEPWQFVSVIASATEWRNFFALRAHKDAQPEMQKIAWMALELYRSSTPRPLRAGEWHLPLVNGDERMLRVYTTDYWVRVSAGRCARVSYLTHDGKRDPDADLKLHDQLLVSRHMSPFEHQARALATPEWFGNFCGWKQYRKDLPNESGDESAFPEAA